jgi:hypothetical protein
VSVHVFFRVLARDRDIVTVSGVVEQAGEMSSVISTALQHVDWTNALHMEDARISGGAYSLDGEIAVQYRVTRVVLP